MLRTLRFSLLTGRYCICKLPPDAPVPDWASQPSGFCSLTRTADELSIVCKEEAVPPEANPAGGWICLKLEGPFALSEPGVLSSFLAPLAASAVGILAISTFETDYVLIQAQSWPKASDALRAAGHEEVAARRS